MSVPQTLQRKGLAGNPSMSQPRPTIYLDSNIPSVLHYRGSNIGTLHQQMVTREWWETERDDGLDM
jgi:hypothetical protein